MHGLRVRGGRGGVLFEVIHKNYSIKWLALVTGNSLVYFMTLRVNIIS